MTENVKNIYFWTENAPLQPIFIYIVHFMLKTKFKESLHPSSPSPQNDKANILNWYTRWASHLLGEKLYLCPLHSCWFGLQMSSFVERTVFGSNSRTRRLFWKTLVRCKQVHSPHAKVFIYVINPLLFYSRFKHSLQINISKVYSCYMFKSKVTVKPTRE